MSAHWKRVVRWAYWVGSLILCAGVLVLTVKRALAQSAPAPVLTITLVNTNQVRLTISNGLSTANYQIHRRPFLDPAHPWSPLLIGSQGQTNFTASVGIEPMLLFGASAGLDWDQDGVPNWQDGNPISPSVGLLSITIDSPATGSTLH